VLEVFEDSLRNYLLAEILGKGYGPEDYALMSYGGGGPLHVAGYTSGVEFQDILIPAWAPGFSAFGCACGDYEYRYDKTLDLPLGPNDPPEQVKAVGQAITAAWEGLKEQVAAEFDKSGVSRDAISFQPGVRMLYRGQLNDLEFHSPVQSIESENDIAALYDAFEMLYGRLYGLGARTPQAGYLVTAVVMSGVVEAEKPQLPTERPAGAGLEMEAIKQSRDIYSKGEWIEATIIDLDKLRAGNVIEGPAVVESPSSTMLVPPGRNVRLDERRIFHMSVNGEENIRKNS
jgi:N-methylhydantoinase A/oxoprolinase/acetone carboxylase beta subunit